MTKKELLYILSQLPNDDDPVYFEAEDLGEVGILSAVVLEEEGHHRLVLLEDFDDTLGNDDEEEVEVIEVPQLAH